MSAYRDPSDASKDREPLDAGSSSSSERSVEEKSIADRSRAELRLLELELQKTRSEAEAARLEAKAVQLKLQIERLSHGLPCAVEPSGDFLRADAAENRSVESMPESDASLFESWSQFRGAIEGEANEGGKYEGGNAQEAFDSSSAASPTNANDEEASEPPILLSSGQQDVSLRVDRSHESASVESESDEVLFQESIGKREPGSGANFDGDVSIDSVDADSEEETESSGRARPAAWMISALVHAAILFLLALFTISNHRPGDQVALSGSVSDTEEIAIESISIETAEMEVSESEPVPAETQYELSDIGEMAITELSMDAPPAPPSPLMDALAMAPSANKAMMSLKSDSDSKMKFCGVEGGGNHFVYLVDSSGSMGDAFTSARRELLQSIDALKAEQKFYVIFFDADSDYMRLSSPDEDEPRSVYATPSNKAAVRQWAMTIQMDRGRAPYDALPFAIELRPDVIFLLSDGEFPQTIEDLLNEINRVENLFGDNDPISIVHTIGYHSREGESRMKRIAKQHGGQYRHVAKP